MAGDAKRTRWSEKGKTDAVKTVAGLIAVSLGLAAVVLIALFGMGFVKTDNPSVVSIATASFGVIGTVVGAYFGVKIGTEGTQKAVDSMKDEAEKAQIYAAHLEPSRAQQALADIERLRAAGGPGQPSTPPAGPPEES